MTTLDLHPNPQAAPPAARIRNHARTEIRLVMRNGEQLLLALVIPIGILVAGRFLGERVGLTMDLLAPSVLALAIYSTCFTSQAIMTGFERRYAVLERLSATPLGRSGLLAGKATAYCAISLAQVILLVIVSLALGWHPHGSAVAWVPALVSVILAMLAFGFLALAMAGRLKAEVTLGVANLVYIVGVVAGAILWPLADYPKAIRPVIAILPTAALGESLRAWGAGQTLWWPLASLFIWAILLGLLARKVFRWIS
ncbi:ABC transporter permease [Cutibacterium equinum]|uniref:ABC transporter permease n=1 Tax=Cutibacterium equinum TaxID=3016342 RepID=A0ABY7QW72_9ACTN|nr:ABC transporter permease [Cutibacterium equinum]WCC79311.1 ABC transporter permease [Cutibacterium equinum]